MMILSSGRAAMRRLYSAAIVAAILGVILGGASHLSGSDAWRYCYPIAFIGAITTVLLRRYR